MNLSTNEIRLLEILLETEELRILDHAGPDILKQAVELDLLRSGLGLPLVHRHDPTHDGDTMLTPMTFAEFCRLEEIVGNVLADGYRALSDPPLV